MFPILALVMTTERILFAVVAAIAAAALAGHFFRKDEAAEKVKQQIDNAATNASVRGFDKIALLLKSRLYGNRAAAAAVEEQVLAIMADDKRFDAEMDPVFEQFFIRIKKDKRFAEFVRKHIATRLKDDRDAMLELKEPIAEMIGWSANNKDLAVWLARVYGAAVKDHPEILVELWPLAEAFVMTVTKDGDSCKRFERLYHEAELKNCKKLDFNSLEILEHTEVRAKKPTFSTLTEHPVDRQGSINPIHIRGNTELYGQQSNTVLQPPTPGQDTTGYFQNAQEMANAAALLRQQQASVAAANASIAATNAAAQPAAPVAPPTA